MFCDTDCTFPTCGDGLTNMLFGEECDDMGESATCDDDCTAAACGDGKLNVTAGEQCEDGNMDDGDGWGNMGWDDDSHTTAARAAHSAMGRKILE